MYKKKKKEKEEKHDYNCSSLRCLYWELVTFLLTPNSNCVTSVEDIGLQPTPLSWSLYGIIREFIPWPPDIVGIQTIWPPCLVTTTVTLYTPQHATTHQLGSVRSTRTLTHIHTRNPGLVTRLWGRCASSGSPSIIPDLRFCSRPISGAQHHSITSASNASQSGPFRVALSRTTIDCTRYGGFRNLPSHAGRVYRHMC